jgi:hypothetical protein
MRKAVLICALALLALPVWALTPYVNNAVSVTDTSQTLTLTSANIGFSSVLTINDGANEVFVCVWRTSQTAVACTSALGFKLNTGESMELTHGPSDDGRGYNYLSIVCSAGETATARVFAK